MEDGKKTSVLPVLGEREVEVMKSGFCGLQKLGKMNLNVNLDKNWLESTEKLNAYIIMNMDQVSPKGEVLELEVHFK